jgi:hypothetical protein
VRPRTAARVGIEDGVTGFQADDVCGFTCSLIRLMENPDLRQTMGQAARKTACSRSWTGVFDQLYRTYQTGLEMIGWERRQLSEVPVSQ